MDKGVNTPAGRARGRSDEDRVRQLEQQVEGLAVAVRSRDVIGQAKGVLVSHFAMSADDAFGILVRLSQHTNTKLAGVAAAFVARVRDRGPAGPRCCRVVTEVVDELLGAAGQEWAPWARCGRRRHRPPIRADRHPAAGLTSA